MTEPLRIELRSPAVPDEVAPMGLRRGQRGDHAHLRLDQIRAVGTRGRSWRASIVRGRILSLVVATTGRRYPPATPRRCLSSPDLARTGDPSPPIRTAVVPTNDTCAGAENLDLDTTIFGNSAEAIDDYRSTGNASCYSGIGQTTSTAAFIGLGRDVAYKFTAPDAGAYCFRGAAYALVRSGSLLPAACPAPPPAATVPCIAARIVYGS